MKKFLLLILVAFQFQSCIKPGLTSIVDNNLFSKPYVDPQFYLMYSDKKEKKIATKFADAIRESLNASGMYPTVKVIDLNEMSESEIKIMQEKALSEKTADVFFSFNIIHMSIYETYGLQSITDFSCVATAFDYKINKEVWKSNIYSPYDDDSVLKSAKMLVEKLKFDKVL